MSFKYVPGVAVCGAWTCVCTKLIFRLHHARYSCCIFTALWCGCSFVKLAFYLQHTPSWLWLVGTAVQTMSGFHRITDMRQVHEYPDSTISKVLTILKWWLIMTFNRKLLEKQSVNNHFASYEVHIGQFFYNVKATVSFGNRLYSDFKFFHWTDWLTDRVTDRRTKPIA